MKALTKPEKFRTTSHIYGYEEEYDYVDGEECVSYGFQEILDQYGNVIDEVEIWECESTSGDVYCDGC